MLIWTLVTHAFSSTVNSAIGLTLNSAISISPTANSAFQQDKKKILCHMLISPNFAFLKQADIRYFSDDYSLHMLK